VQEVEAGNFSSGAPIFHLCLSAQEEILALARNTLSLGPKSLCLHETTLSLGTNPLAPSPSFYANPLSFATNRLSLLARNHSLKVLRWILITLPAGEPLRSQDGGTSGMQHIKRGTQGSIPSAKYASHQSFSQVCFAPILQLNMLCTNPSAKYSLHQSFNQICFTPILQPNMLCTNPSTKYSLHQSFG
jgi:hypothetical protein